MQSKNGTVADDLVITIANDMDGFKEAMRQVGDRLTAWQVEERPRYIIELALDELLTNIIRYAYEKPRSGNIDIRLHRDADCTSLMLVDQGKPFDPINTAPLSQSANIEEARIGGRGLIMIRQLASNLNYFYENGSNHLEVVARNNPT